MRYCCNVRIHSLEIRGLCLMKWPTSKMLQDLSYFLNVIKKLLCAYLVFQKYVTFWSVSIWNFMISSKNICFLRSVLCTYVLSWYEWKGILYVTFFHSRKFIKCFNFFPTKNCIQCFSIFSCLLHIPKAPSINYVDEFLDFLNPLPPCRLL